VSTKIIRHFIILVVDNIKVKHNITPVNHSHFRLLKKMFRYCKNDAVGLFVKLYCMSDITSDNRESSFICLLINIIDSQLY